MKRLTAFDLIGCLVRHQWFTGFSSITESIPFPNSFSPIRVQFWLDITIDKETCCWFRVRTIFCLDILMALSIYEDHYAKAVTSLGYHTETPYIGYIRFFTELKWSRVDCSNGGNKLMVVRPGWVINLRLSTVLEVIINLESTPWTGKFFTLPIFFVLKLQDATQRCLQGMRKPVPPWLRL